jgi:hypothetical protein
VTALCASLGIPAVDSRGAARTPFANPRLSPVSSLPEEVFQLKQLVLIAVAAAVLLLPGSAVAGGVTTTVESFPADFEMSWQTCPNLPEGTTITGTGTGRSVTKTKTDRHGITTVFNSSIARSKATDQDGNRYRFFYFNQFRVSNTTADPDLYSGLMVDLFLLKGNGPARLENGFLARITTDLGDFFTFDPIHAFGDPINFDTGEAICDPL